MCMDAMMKGCTCGPFCRSDESEGLLSGAVILDGVGSLRARVGGTGDGIFALFAVFAGTGLRLLLFVDALAAAEWTGVATLCEPLRTC